MAYIKRTVECWDSRAFVCAEQCCEVGMDTELPFPDGLSVEIRPMYEVLDERCWTESGDSDSCGCPHFSLQGRQPWLPDYTPAEYIAEVEMEFFAAWRREESVMDVVPVG